MNRLLIRTAQIVRASLLALIVAISMSPIIMQNDLIFSMLLVPMVIIALIALTIAVEQWLCTLKYRQHQQKVRKQRQAKVCRHYGCPCLNLF